MKQIKKLSILILFCIVMFSCKKNNQRNNNNDTNDPNIYDFSINSTHDLTTINLSKELCQDLDGNGFDDICLSLYGDYPYTNTSIHGAGINVDSDHFKPQYGGKNSSQLISEFINGKYYLIKFNKGDIINSDRVFSKNGAACFIKDGSNITGNILPNTEAYIGFKIKLESDNLFHNGWLRIKIGSDGNSITLIDGAYHLNAGAEISVGQK